MEKVVHKVASYIQSNSLFTKNDKLLLAVSGGVDSMVMVQILTELGFQFSVAHCNFQLRDNESDKDEAFVERHCLTLNIPFYSKRFNTSQYAKSKGISIQMAARELRYAWFEELIELQGFDFVLTAHHANDVAETMLINLTQGTGISGLTGIKAKRGVLVRPLLSVGKKEIEAFGVANDVVFREDASNSDNKYKRNAIRNQVIPDLEQLNSKVIQHLNDTAGYLADVVSMVQPIVLSARDQCVKDAGDGIEISLTALQEYQPVRAYLYYFLTPYGFNASQLSSIYKGFEGISGKRYISDTHELFKDRGRLIVQPLKDSTNTALVIEELEDFNQLKVEAELIPNMESLQFENLSQLAYLDYDKLNFPLKIRNWQQGDRFQPMGMSGQKKVSDFLIDQKVSLPKKQGVNVLLSGDDICWLMGFRIHDDYKVTADTKSVLKLKYPR